MFRSASVRLLSRFRPPGKPVISAHSGLVNFVEGEVQIAGRPVKLDGAIFPDVKIGQILSTQTGHAEGFAHPGRLPAPRQEHRVPDGFE